MSRNNNGFPRQDNWRRGPDYGPYHLLRQDSGVNRMSSVFPMDTREGGHYPWQLSRERISSAPVIMNSVSVPPYISNQNQFPNYGATRIPTAQRPVEEDSKLTRDEQKRVLDKLKREIYNPTPKWLERRPSLYYRDNPIHNPRETDNDKDDDGKRCAVCLEDFEPKEMVTVTPCNHMFHEECIVPWVKSQGQCPVCRFSIHEKLMDNAPPSRNVLGSDPYDSEVMSLMMAMEQAFLSESMRRMN